MNKRPFPHASLDDWKTFIQWKGTDVCMDWICDECGKHNHEDRDFMYEVQCHNEEGTNFVTGKPDFSKGCGAVYVVGTEVALYRLDTEKYKRFGEGE